MEPVCNNRFPRGLSSAAEVFLLLPLLCILPFLFLLFLFRSLVLRKAVFRPLTLQGAGRSVLHLHEFDSENRILRNLPLATAVLRGEMNLVGVARRLPGTTVPDEILLEKPGLFTLEFVRRGSRIAHQNCDEIDLEYLRGRSLKHEIGVILRSLPALLFSGSGEACGPVNHLFGVPFANLTMKQALEQLDNCLEERKRVRVSFVNPDCFNKVWKDDSYRKLLLESDFVFPDGIGLVIAGNMVGRPLCENVNGTDMLPFLCEMAVGKNRSIYLLGAERGVAELAAEHLKKRFPGLNLCGTRHGYFASPEEKDAAVVEIARLAPDFLLVAMGVPTQERFLKENWSRLNCGVGMGVGGLFDFYSGRIRRAPKWLRECGMEWSWRLAMEPRRMFRRYVIGNPLFLMRVMRYRGELPPARREGAHDAPK